jgi:hypothetical protein
MNRRIVLALRRFTAPGEGQSPIAAAAQFEALALGRIAAADF